MPLLAIRGATSDGVVLLTGRRVVSPNRSPPRTRPASLQADAAKKRRTGPNLIECHIRGANEQSQGIENSLKVDRIRTFDADFDPS